jgi:hypothetical protein
VNLWYIGAALASFFLFFKGTAPVKGAITSVPRLKSRADVPDAASSEMKGMDDFPEVGPRTGTELVESPARPKRNPFEAGENGSGVEGNGHPEPEDGTLSDEDMSDLDETEIGDGDEDSEVV